MAVLRPPLVAPDEETTAGRSALRKASVRLLPLIALGYATATIDRVNISFAALQMNRDLHFSASVYGLGAGLFFLSYAVCEVPSNLLLVRFGARRWLARIMFTWGLLSIGMLFVRTPHQFYAMRFLLGIAEAGFFPGVIYYLSRWFPAAYRSRAVSRFYISLPLSSVVMGALAGALLQLQGRWGLAGWQWLFLLEGLPALVLSVVFLLCLPDGPATAKWLSSEETGWLLERLRRDDLAAGGTHGRGDIAHAFRQPRVWLLGGFLFCMYVGYYALTFTLPTIVQTMTGLSPTRVGFIVAILGVLGALAMLLNGAHSDRTGERYLHVGLPCLLAAAGFTIASLAAQPLAVMAGLACIVAGHNAMNGPVWSIPCSFLTGKSAAAGIAAINMVSILGGFAGPYWMGLAAGVTGNYRRGLLTFALPAFTAAALIAIVRHMARDKRVSAPGDCDQSLS